MENCNKDLPAPIDQEDLTFERDPACFSSDVPTSEPGHIKDVLDIDVSCEDNEIEPVPLDNADFTESDMHDVHVQGRSDSGTNPENPFSLDSKAPVPPADGHLGVCLDYAEPPHVPCIKIENKEGANWRNPITGFGLNGDGVGGLKPKKLKDREGNPVTGEGYKPGATDFIQPAIIRNVAGNKQVINKKRVPPGGYSSGLW